MTAGLAEHHAARVHVVLRCSPECALKSVPLDVLAIHLGMHQHGLKL